LNLPVNGLTVGTNQLVASSGRVGIGTATPNEQLELTGNLRLPATTATTGIIKSGALPLIHTFGTNNFFAGENAGNFTTTGSGANTGIGVSALVSNATGANNTATGWASLTANTDGSRNTAIGSFSLQLNSSGNNNTANGTGSLSKTTIGDNNSAFGDSALGYNTEGNLNTAIGYGAGSSLTNTTGSNNTFIGANSGPGTAVGLINATAIGYGATVGQSNSLVLGSSIVKVGIGTTSPGTYLDVQNIMRVTGTTSTAWPTTGEGLELAYRTDLNKGYIQAYDRGAGSFGTLDINASAVTIGGGGSLSIANIPSGATTYSLCASLTNSGMILRCASTRRLKKDISDLPFGLETVKALRPVTFTWKTNGLEDVGFIAEEVAQVQPVLAIFNEQGEPDGVKYSNMSAVLVKAVQEQQTTIDQLKAELAELRRLINR
jgi:hypothetical protein